MNMNEMNNGCIMTGMDRLALAGLQAHRDHVANRQRRQLEKQKLDLQRKRDRVKTLTPFAFILKYN